MITFKHHSGIYSLETKTQLSMSLEKAWSFFSSPKNLQTITPAYMGFQITSDYKEKAYRGQIITYRVGILPGIKSNWVTEITQLEEGTFFVDEQRFGPYSMWHHEHHFEENENGVEMYDKVSFKLPLGPLGDLAFFLFVKSKLTEIFEYRTKKLDELFS